MRFNTDVVFTDTSGQVRSQSGDLTLRSESGGDVVVGSGGALRPELPLVTDLGRDYLPWRHLYAGGGSFAFRPTVQGSGVLLQGEQGVFGDYRQDAASDGVSTTSSSAYQNKVTMTTPNLPPGRYRIGWSCDYASDKAARSVRLRVLAGGTTIAEPMPNVGPGANDFFPACGFGYTQTSGVTTVTLDFSTQAGGGPTYHVSVRNARLELWRVS